MMTTKRIHTATHADTHTERARDRATQAVVLDKHICFHRKWQPFSSKVSEQLTEKKNARESFINKCIWSCLTWLPLRQIRMDLQKNISLVVFHETSLFENCCMLWNLIFQFEIWILQLQRKKNKRKAIYIAHSNKNQNEVEKNSQQLWIELVLWSMIVCTCVPLIGGATSHDRISYFQVLIDVQHFNSMYLSLCCCCSVSLSLYWDCVRRYKCSKPIVTCNTQQSLLWRFFIPFIMYKTHRLLIFHIDFFDASEQTRTKQCMWQAERNQNIALQHHLQCTRERNEIRYPFSLSQFFSLLAVLGHQCIYSVRLSFSLQQSLALSLVHSFRRNQRHAIVSIIIK